MIGNILGIGTFIVVVCIVSYMIIFNELQIINETNDTEIKEVRTLQEIVRENRCRELTNNTQATYDRQVDDWNEILLYCISDGKFRMFSFEKITKEDINKIQIV